MIAWCTLIGCARNIVWARVRFDVRNIVSALVLFCTWWLVVHVIRSVYACATARLFYAYCFACSRSGFSLLYCYFNFCYLMFHLYFLFVLIYLLLHAYNDFCLTVFCWLITSHKSIPDLEIDPSRVTVKIVKCRPWYSISTPFFPFFGGFKGPEGSTDRWRGLRNRNMTLHQETAWTGKEVYITEIWHYTKKQHGQVKRLT